MNVIQVTQLRQLLFRTQKLLKIHNYESLRLSRLLFLSEPHQNGHADHLQVVPAHLQVPTIIPAQLLVVANRPKNVPKNSSSTYFAK